MLGMFAVFGVSVLLVSSLAVEAATPKEDEPARIVGRITDSTGWGFLPGAKITLRRYVRPLVLARTEVLREDVAYETETDEKGRYEISGINPRHRYALIAEFPGFYDGVIRGIYLDDGEKRLLDLGLRVGIGPMTFYFVEGRVFDESGDPVADATVILSAPLDPDPRLVHRTRTGAKAASS